MDKNSPNCEICERSFKSGRAKLIHYTRIHEKKDITPIAGFSKCGDPRCMTCKKGIFVNELLITETKETHKITQPITCKTSNLVYCITCLKCRDQYIGETGQELHRRQSGHINDIKEKRTGLPYVRHFLKCGIDNYSITGVEKVRSRDPQIRKQREGFYKKLFKVKIK